jgi:hypothetical protein
MSMNAVNGGRLIRDGRTSDEGTLLELISIDDLPNDPS